MTDYYITKNGTGSGAGTEADPFLTFAEANAHIAAGDTVHVSDGIYHEVVKITIDGKRDPVGSSLTTTFKAKSGQNAVFVDGLASGTFSGLPQSSPGPTSPIGLRFSWDAMVQIDSAKYVVWDGIHVCNSLGNGIRVKYNCDNVTVKNCSVYNNRHINVWVYGPTPGRPQNTIVDNVTAFLSGMNYPRVGTLQENYDWGASIAVRGSDYTTIKNCTVHSSWGEGIIFDAEKFGSTNTTVEDNVIYDTWSAPIFVHRTNTGVVQRNYIYRSSTDKARSNPFGGGGQAGIIIQSNELWATPNFSTEDIKIVANIIGNTSGGILARARSGIAPLKNILIANNTVSNCGLGIQCDNNMSLELNTIVLKNNLVTGCTTPVAQNDYGWVYDYNGWDGSYSLFSGANDTIGSTADIEDYDHNPVAGAGDPTQYNHASGGNYIDAGDDLTAAYATAPAADKLDYFGNAPGGTWDLGAHQDGAVSRPSITVVPTPDPATVVAGNTISFNSTVTGGTAAYTYAWTFPGGSPSTSTDADPANIVYGIVGTYTATGVVTDANGLTDTVTEAISITAQSVGTSQPVTVEQVIFNAGAASYAVSDTPSAIMFFWSGGISDATKVSDAEWGCGIYDVSNNQSYGLGAYMSHGETTTNNGNGISTSYPIWIIGGHGSTTATGSISSVTSSAVNLSWTGTTASEKIISLNFYGSGLSNVLATAQYMGTDGSNNVLSGDYNFVFMPAYHRALNTVYGPVDFSIGFAERGVNQACLAFGSTDDVTTTETTARLYTNYIAGWALYNLGIEITAWTDSGITFTPRGRDANVLMPLLAMKFSSAVDVYIGVEDTPTSTGNNDYTSAGFDAQVMLGFSSLLTAIDSSATGSAIIGALSVNSSGTDRTVMISSKDNVSTSVESSYTDSDYCIIDEDGAMTDEGPATIITNGFRLAPTTAAGTAYKMLTVLFEDSSTGSGPTAAFDYSPKGDELDYDDTIQFTDLSTYDGTYPITGWSWDWGDGTANGTTQNPTHSYASEGSYIVTLEVTDSNSATDTTDPETIVVNVPGASVLFTTTPTSGAIPLSVDLDASTSTPGGNELLDEDAVYWEITSSDYKVEYTGGFHSIVHGHAYFQTGIEATVILEEVSVWDVKCVIRQSSTAQLFELTKHANIKTITDLIGDFDSQHGKTSVTGPYTANFEAQLNFADPEGVYYDWDFGDGVTDSGYDKITTSHIYGAHAGQYYLYFNGTTSGIDCGSDAALDDLHDAAMTVEAWIRADGYGENNLGHIVTKENWSLYIDSTNGLVGLIDCATTDGLTYSTTANLTADGAWHHVAMTWDDATFTYPKLWIDGVEYSTTTQARSGAIVTDAAAVVHIGNNTADDRAWDGGIGWVRISNSVLYTATFTPPNVGGPPETTTTTVEQWNLNDGSGTTAEAEEDTPANDGTITAGTWYNYTGVLFEYDVSLDITLPGNDPTSPDDTITKPDYITITAIPDTPLNVVELTAIAAEVKKHIGCMADATWVQEGAPNTSVYTATISRKWASGYTYTVKEDAQNLSSQASIVACQAAAGSYYVNYSDPNLVVSVHTTGSDDPSSNGSVYSLRFT